MRYDHEIAETSQPHTQSIAGPRGSGWHVGKNLPEMEVKHKNIALIETSTDIVQVFDRCSTKYKLYSFVWHAKAFEQIHNPVFHYCVNLDLRSTVLI